jgi:hypothetical protein
MRSSSHTESKRCFSDVGLTPILARPSVVPVPDRRRVILLAVLAVVLGLFLLDVHGSPTRLMDDLRETLHDLGRGDADTSARQ